MPSVLADFGSTGPAKCQLKGPICAQKITKVLEPISATCYRGVKDLVIKWLERLTSTHRGVRSNSATFSRKICSFEIIANTFCNMPHKSKQNEKNWWYRASIGIRMVSCRRHVGKVFFRQSLQILTAPIRQSATQKTDYLRRDHKSVGTDVGILLSWRYRQSAIGSSPIISRQLCIC